jgi:ribosomal protein S18 acetylase RimI-like enzyme
VVDAHLAARAEDAGLNASAPPEQRWLDGWIVRWSPGKAKRARCINAVAAGRRNLDEKLAECGAVYRAVGLPMVVRITPFTQPPDLDAQLAQRGFCRLDDTRVMLLPALAGDLALPPLPGGFDWTPLASADFAQTVGGLRGTPPAAIAAHARRLATAPVPAAAFGIASAGRVIACGQFVREGDLVGLYDIFTREDHRGRRLAGILCERLLARAAREGARAAYLQVEHDNAAARRVYARLGFADSYAYHYRQAPAPA